MTAPADAGAGSLAGLEAIGQVNADGAYRVQLLVRDSDERSRLWLEAAGFQQGPGGTAGWTAARSPDKPRSASTKATLRLSRSPMRWATLGASRFNP